MLLAVDRGQLGHPSLALQLRIRQTVCVLTPFIRTSINFFSFLSYSSLLAGSDHTGQPLPFCTYHRVCWQYLWVTAVPASTLDKYWPGTPDKSCSSVCSVFTLSWCFRSRKKGRKLTFCSQIHPSCKNPSCHDADIIRGIHFTCQCS